MGQARTEGRSRGVSNAFGKNIEVIPGRRPLSQFMIQDEFAKTDRPKNFMMIVDVSKQSSFLVDLANSVRSM